MPKDFISYAAEWEAKIASFIELDLDCCPDAEKLPVSGEAAIAGLPFAVKDNIAVKDLLLTCGSRMLENFRSPYSATAVNRLKAAGGIVIGKTNLDEFGMGSSTDNSALKRTNNPWDLGKVAGGSSGGCAAAVAAGIVPYALGADTGGSVRQPAAFCGITGLKPTYGAVSRYGLVAYAPSLETVGILADTASRCRAVFSIIRGRDEKDRTSRDAPQNAPPLYPIGPESSKKIGVLSPGPFLEDEVRLSFNLAAQRLAAMGHTLVDIDIPCLKYCAPAYYTIAAAEASANLARFDGIRYGICPDAKNPDDLIDKARTEGFGPEVKLRILLGTFVLRSGFQDRYYLQAQRIRDSIRKSFEALLGNSEYKEPGKLDAILMPVFPTRAFGRGADSLSAFDQKAADVYTCCANLSGLPALAFPVSAEGGLPTGVQLLGRAFAEGTLLEIAEACQRQFPFPHPPGYRSFWS